MNQLSKADEMRATALGAGAATLMIFAALTIIVAGAGSALEDKTYMSISGGGTRCVYVLLPDDMGEGFADSSKTQFIVSVDTALPIETFSYIETEAGGGVEVKVPICFSSIGMPPQSKHEYEIELSAPEMEKSRVFTGGVCISAMSDDTCAVYFGQAIPPVEPPAGDQWYMVWAIVAIIGLIILIVFLVAFLKPRK